MTINDLCNNVLMYILSINISNKSSIYTQSGYLKVNGTPIQTHTYKIKYCPSAYGGNGPKKTTDVWETNATVTQTVKTSETINAVYCQQATDERIINDWNNFKSSYISKMLNVNETISLSSIFVFMYLVRCFIDTRFALFTDAYHNTFVWLYNTSTTVDYKISNSVSPSEFTKISKGLNVLDTFISALVDEVSNRRSVHILKSTLSTTVTSS